LPFRERTIGKRGTGKVPAERGKTLAGVKKGFSSRGGRSFEKKGERDDWKGEEPLNGKRREKREEEWGSSQERASVIYQT